MRDWCHAALWLAVFLFPTSTLATADAPPPIAAVELLVRGPDGRAAADVPIVVTPNDRGGLRGQPPPDAHVRTDAAGVARFDWPAGASRMNVAAAGVGYGMTGLTELRPDQPARPPLPPLVPYAIVEGTVPPAVAATPGAAVTLRANSVTEVVAPIAADGTFRAEVPAGQVWVDASDGKRRLAKI